MLQGHALPLHGADGGQRVALGADFVFIGRPFNHAATIAGAAGIAHAVDILMREIDCNLGLLGINTLAERSVRSTCRGEAKCRTSRHPRSGAARGGRLGDCS